MKCHGPLQGWFSKDRTATGKRRVVFRRSEGFDDMPVQVPCGTCSGCLLERARQWAVRCVHEASLWSENSYVTLTYGDKVPRNSRGEMTLRPSDFVNFMKRLRKEKEAVRFFQCGEYGELGRPHHHALLFNCGFDDRRLIGYRRGLPIYRSEQLERLWPLGYSTVGDVSFESAGYVARYTLKKVGKEQKPGVVAEYLTMSRRPGVAAGWYERFKGDVFPSDEVVVRGGRVMRPPRFYDERLAVEDPALLAALKVKRQESVKEEENRGSRDYARQELTRMRVERFLRREVS